MFYYRLQVNGVSKVDGHGDRLCFSSSLGVIIKAYITVVLIYLLTVEGNGGVHTRLSAVCLLSWVLRTGGVIMSVKMLVSTFP